MISNVEYELWKLQLLVKVIVFEIETRYRGQDEKYWRIKTNVLSEDKGERRCLAFSRRLPRVVS